jgi:putative ABC transport system substrate-binding protein
MRRRDFITLLGRAAAAWPLAARAQPNVPVVGILSATEREPPYMSAFYEALKEQGFMEGVNFRTEYRWADGEYQRLPGLVAELVRRPAAVIFANGGNPSALAAKAATTTIPIVFAIGGDPVQLGLVKSLSRPGGNITGATNVNNELDSKRLGLIVELVPDATTIGFLVNPKAPNTPDKTERVRAAGKVLQRKIEILSAGSPVEIDDAFVAIARRRIQAVVVTGDNILSQLSEKIAASTKQYMVPVISAYREVPASGGLMSYGPSVLFTTRQAGVYVARILRGEKPNDLPVIQPTKFDLVINLATAKALGITVPQDILTAADQVIE